MDFRDIKEFLSDSFKYLIMVVFVLFMVIYVISLQQVVGPSMDPTLKDGDVLLLNKAEYNFFAIKRSDIVALKYDQTKFLIKRVIGLPGDYIEFKDNVLYINDKKVEESYLKNITTSDFSIKSLGYSKIPKGNYLVLGDNRENSLDSRKIGLIKKKDIIGKVMLRVFPITNLKFF